MNDEKAKYWELFSEGLELPDIEELLTRKVTPDEVYYLLERYATLIIWNAEDLSPSKDGTVIEIEGASKHFNVYDFGNALVMTPVDLISSERTYNDALQTAIAMIHLEYHRASLSPSQTHSSMLVSMGLCMWVMV